MAVKKICFFFLIALLSSIHPYGIFAQPGQDIFSRLNASDASDGMIKIYQENNIRNLVDYHVEQQSAINGTEVYRIRIFSESGQEAKTDAYEVRRSFISKYENVNCYTVFENPFFKLYVGDFRTKSDALRFNKVIEKDYPDAFIGPPIIIPFPD